MHSRKQNRRSNENRAALFCRTASKIIKPSINIDFLPLFHIKHRLKLHISTPLNPSALPHDRRHQTTKHIGQCKHASIVLLRSILRRFTYSAPLSAISRRFGHICPITRDTRLRQTLFAQYDTVVHAPHALITCMRAH